MIGIDIVAIDRIKKLITKYDSTFINRIFSIYEIKYAKKFTNCHSIASFFAKRFAVKEAYIKALGGMNSEFSLTDIDVRNNNRGKGYLYLKGEKQNNVEISISDEKEYAVAFVMIRS